MTSEEIIEAYLFEDYRFVFESQEGFTLNDVYQNEDFITIDDHCIFRVQAVYSTLNRNATSIDIKTPDNNDLGLLLLLRDRTVLTLGEMSSSDFLAYLCEVPKESFGHLPYTFQNDHVIVFHGNGTGYRQKYYDTAPIWGQFTHSPPPSSPLKSVTALTAIDDIALPSQHHIEAFSRYVHSANPLERYLRLYHCVELLFDAVVVLKIKKLGADIRDFSSIMSEHGKGELDRLRAIAVAYVTAPEELAEKFLRLVHYVPTATKVFQDFSKDGNTLSPKDSADRWQNLVNLLVAGKYRKNDFDRAVLGKDTYENFVCKTAAYWIYRTRCSIAHSRVGEFILEDSDQDFVIDFAEPMLLEFVRQVFTAQSLHDII